MALAGLLAMITTQSDLQIADYPQLTTAQKFDGDPLIDRVNTVAKVYRGPGPKELTLDNGLVRRVFRFDPTAATVQLFNLQTGENFLRSVKPEALLTINGKEYRLGGLLGQPNQAFLKPEWLESMTADPEAFRLTRVSVGTCNEPFKWNQSRRNSNRVWPPRGIQITLVFQHPDFNGLLVEVKHELYDGIPVFMKRMVVRNNSTAPVKIDRYTTEILGVVETTSEVEAVSSQMAGNLETISDYSFGGMDHRTADKGTHWVADPDYHTQVNYRKLTPCLLRSEPPVGPAKVLPPGQRLDTHRSFVLLHDGADRERRGLTVRRFYRLLAPWTTESPIMLHLTTTEPEKVKAAIDQAAEVGFEMVILSFGSGLNMEDVSEPNLAKFTELRRYASSKGLELGGYSLLASRSIDPENDAINPETGKPGGMIFGNSPCLCSRWGIDYFQKIITFMTRTGFNLLEHDGSYPGDLCASTNHPGHQGLADSQWEQWLSITRLYENLRLRGTYLNVPDWYVLNGSNKTGMGYRETNWSLPRDQQHLHARQNMFDGTWIKPPTAGWMFVPLTEYHGGGPAATMEPLSENLQDYERHLQNAFGYGVQACYRGPRLYDTDQTKAVVIKWTNWFKKYRDILESDIIHLRRPDGQRLDFILHVNPNLTDRAMLVVYNPLDKPLTEKVQIPLRYAGLHQKTNLMVNGAPPIPQTLNNQQEATLTLNLPPQGFAYYIFR